MSETTVTVRALHEVVAEPGCEVRIAGGERPVLLVGHDKARSNRRTPRPLLRQLANLRDYRQEKHVVMLAPEDMKEHE